MNSRQPLVQSTTPLSGVRRLIWIISFLALWAGLTQNDLVSPLILPKIGAVIQSIQNIGFTIVTHAVATILRATGGFILGGFLGIILGTYTQFSKVGRHILEPFWDASRPVPAIALLPLFIVLFGFSEGGRIALVSIGVMVLAATTTIEALAKIPEAWVRFARLSGMSKPEIFLRILLPGAVPFVAGPARIILAVAFTLAIASEFMGAQFGLGYLINVARVNLEIPTIWVSILVLGMVCLAADKLLVIALSHYSKWYKTSDNEHRRG